MKKIFSILFALFITTMVFADVVEVDGIYYDLDTESRIAEVTSGTNGYSGYITIPSTIAYNGGEYRVVSIGYCAFLRNSNLISIEIPNSVSYIGQGAFHSCSSLKYITIPNSVTYIGDQAFQVCTSLISVTIPNSVTYIGDLAFNNCSSLATIIMSTNIAFIGKDAFDNTSWINNQPDGCLYIGKCLYKYKGTMSANTQIDIKDGTIMICNEAFNWYSNLESVIIPNSVTYIGARAFNGCSSLATIIMSTNIAFIGKNAFDGTPWLVNQPNGCLYIGKCLYVYKGEMSINTHIIIKEGTTMICNNAFYDCSNFESVTIPNSVTSIEEGAFKSCTGLTSVYISDIATWCNIEFRNGDSNPLYYAENLYLNNTKVTDLVIPEGVDSIKDYVFRNCSSLTSITIGNSVTSIGKSAFSDCSSLTSIEILNSVTSIENYAFLNCSNLASVTIPNTVTYIGDYAFGGCGIKDLYVTAKSIEDYCNSSVYEAMLYEHKGLLERKRHLVINGLEITDLVIPETIKTINNNTFMDFSCITEIIIPNSVTSIEGTAFLRCTGLKSVKFGNAITSIGKSAFSDCSSLASIEIPNSVTSIGEGAFGGCTGLNSVKLGKGITSIGRCVFYDCTKLDTIICFATIPADVNGETFDLQYSYNNTKSHYDDCLLLVPKESLDAYKNHEIWGMFKNIKGIKGQYTITTSVNDEMMGAVSEGGVYEENSEIILTAIVKEGHGFVKWSDGNTENPRKVIVSQDSTFTAIFGKLYTIAASVNEERMGIVLGSGEYGEGSEIILTASANEGYHFVKWSDGNTENPRTIVVTENVYLTAEFGLEGIQTPVKDVNKSSVMIYVRNKMIHIEGITEDYQIFDAFGRLVYTGRESALSLPRGVYVVVVEGEVEKVVL